jgi:alcohol dehydrogenase
MANKFTFSIPTRVEFGKGSSKKIGLELLAMFPGSRPKAMIVTDLGVSNAGLLEGVKETLDKADIDYLIFDKVEPNPRDTTVQLAANIFQKEQANALIAVGGGSVMDLAKSAAVIAKYGGEIAQYEGFGKVPGRAFPVIAIPTTAGTASEVTCWSIITNTSKHVKMGIGDLKIAPVVALVDPELTYSLPRSLTLGTGLDALTHAIESYTSNLANPPADALGIEAIRLIMRHLPAAVKDGTNEEAREGMMMGSMLAGMSFGNADCAAVHSLSESIGAVYDSPHGIVNGILLPYVMAYNLIACPEKFATIAKELGADAVPELAVKLVVDLEKSLEVPNLAAFGVKKEDLPKIADLAMAHSCTLANPRIPTSTDFIGILKKTLAGDSVL